MTPRSADAERLHDVADWAAAASAVAVILLSALLALTIVAGSKVPAPQPAAAPVAEAPLGSPLAGERRALMLARHARDVLIGLAARPGGPVDLVPLASDRTPIRLADVRVSIVRDARVAPAPLSRCGSSCIRIGTRVLDGSRVRISVEIDRAGAEPARARFTLPPRLPARGDALLRAVTRRMARVRTYRADQELADGYGRVRARYLYAAPNRVRIEGPFGPSVIVIGTRRWDRIGASWRASRDPGLPVPSYVWQGAASARILGRSRIGRRPVTILALYRPPSPLFPDGSPVWFRLAVAADGRVLQAEMLARAHFMTERYSGFDAPLSIQPPS